MRNILLKIEYDGTNYHGWQIQPHAVTIQQTIIDAIHTFTNECVTLTGASRTDSGVHALSQFANFKTNSKIPLKGFVYGLNHFLPNDIRIINAHDVDEAFSARRNVVRKQYSYFIHNMKTTDAIFHGYYFPVYEPLDIDIMKHGLRLIEQTTDFAAFTSHDPNKRNTHISLEKATLSLLHENSLFAKPLSLIRIDFYNKAFLKHMIRNIVGAIVELGLHKITLPELATIIESCDRREAGMKAPAKGLFLTQIDYINFP